MPQYYNTIMENKIAGTEYIEAVQPVFSTTDTALEMLPTAAYTCNASGHITFYNSEAAQLWGYNPIFGEAIWCGFPKVYNHDGNALLQDAHPVFVALKSGQAVKGTELLIEQNDGSMQTVLFYVKPVYDATGITGVTVVMIDGIPTHKDKASVQENHLGLDSLSDLLEAKVEERTHKLKKSEERYHKMIEEVKDYAIVLLDVDGFIQNWNQGAEKIKGYTEEEILGRNFRIFYLDHDRKNMLPERLIQQALDTGRAMHEGWRLRKDGTRFWGSIVITALHDNENNIIGFSKVTRDLTERKLADDRMANYAQDIEFRNKQLEEYAYIASHDLQEPLRKIQVFSEMLENNLNDPVAAKRSLDKINTSARRMSNLIKDVLKYSQLSRTDELFTEASLNTVLETVMEDFDLLCEEKNIVVKRADLPAIKGIPIQLHQLFSNLLSNAIKFCREDNALIEIDAEPLTEIDHDNYPGLYSDRDYIKITFKDNGAGFDPQYGEQIFKMFKRLTDNTGTGIGLALCKKIVENHHGHISVISEEGKGAEFTIILPVEVV
jgi:PAS domain S-box-containing protein